MSVPVLSNTTQGALLSLLRCSLYGTTSDFPEDTAWSEVLQEARAQAVAALAAPKGQWKRDVDVTLAHNIRLLHEQQLLITLFKIHNLPIAILKGTAVAVYYPDPLRRAMGDIDFIVPQERFEEAAELMKSSGYIPEYGEREDSRHIGYRKNGITIELHHHFSAFGLDVEDCVKDGLLKAETVTVCGSTFPMLPENENGIVLLSHIRTHLMDEQCSLGLRQVIDWMMYAHCCLDEETWSESFQPLAARYGLDTLAITLTYLCKTWLGLPDEVSWCMKADARLAEELLMSVLNSGNFSAKIQTEEKPVKTALLNLRSYGVLRYLQDAGLVNWPAARKYAVLRPFAWCYQLGRYFVKTCGMLFRGEKIGHELTEGYEQQAFLEKLGIL